MAADALTLDVDKNNSKFSHFANVALSRLPPPIWDPYYRLMWVPSCNHFAQPIQSIWHLDVMTWNQSLSLPRRHKHTKTRPLDQVYCAWLIKWIIKREIIQPCLTTWWIISDISRYWLVLGAIGSVWGSTGSLWGGTSWSLVVLGQYGALLVDTWWYWVSIGR